MNDLFNKYRLSEALMAVYKLFWDEFSGWYLELVKPAYGQSISKYVYEATINFFDNLLHLLHPFMPFITEELWQHIANRNNGDSLMVNPMIKFGTYDVELLHKFEDIKDILMNIRAIRQQKGLPSRELLSLEIINNNEYSIYYPILKQLGVLSNIENVTNKSDDAIPFMIHTTEFAIPFNSLIGSIPIEEEIKKAEAELVHKEKMLLGIQKKLSNEKFVNNAPIEIVEIERKKEKDTIDIIESLKKTIISLQKFAK